MGRGDNNLLFGGQLFVKGRGEGKQLAPGLLRAGNLPAGASELFVDSNSAFLRDKRGGIHALNQVFTKKNCPGLPERITSNSHLAYGNGKFVWGDKDGFLIVNTRQPGKADVYKSSLPDTLAGIYINEDKVYAMALDSDDAWKTRLYESSALEDGGWEEVLGYEHGSSYILQKGDTAFIFYTEEKKETSAFATLSPKGPGKIIYLPKNFLTHTDPQSLLAATGDDQGLAIIENEEGEPELRHLSLESFAATGPAKNDLVASLGSGSGLESMFFKTIAASEGRALILASRELILASEEGILEVLPLGEKNNNAFDRLSFAGERAVIWQTHYDAYREFYFPRK